MKKIIFVLLFVLCLGCVIVNTTNVKSSTPNVIYVNRVKPSQTDGNGSYSDPYYKFFSAIDAAKNGDTIMLQSNLTLSGPLKIEKSLKIMTADLDMDGEPINSIMSISRSDSFKSNLIEVNAGKTLTLENITIDGKLSSNKSYDGANIYLRGVASNYAKLIINDNTIIQNGNRKNGGSAVLSSYGEVYMYGGEITKNYSNMGATALGIVQNTGARFYLYGGSIHHNQSASYAINAGSDLKKLVIGGQLEIKNNFKKDDTSTLKNMYVDNIDKIQLQEDFDGEIYISTPDEVKAGDAFNADENIIEGTKYVLHLDDNPNLHLKVT